MVAQLFVQAQRVLSNGQAERFVRALKADLEEACAFVMCKDAEQVDLCAHEMLGFANRLLLRGLEGANERLITGFLVHACSKKNWSVACGDELDVELEQAREEVQSWE